MAYNLKLEGVIEKVIQSWPDLEKKKMFGGVCYPLHGHMAFGVHKDFLIIRAGEDQTAPLLKMKKVLPFAITGKPMKGWFMIPVEDCLTDIAPWLGLGRDFASTLPPK